MAYTDPVIKEGSTVDDVAPDAGGASVKKPVSAIGAPAPPTTAVSNPVMPAPSIVPPATTSDPMAFHPETNPVLKDTPTLGGMTGGSTPAPLGAGSAITTVNGVKMPQYNANEQASQGAYNGLSAAQQQWLTQPRGQDALDAAQGDYGKVNFGEFDHPTVAPNLTQYGFPVRTPAERDALPMEQQIAEHLTVPGDPNNKGFGGTKGVDPTNGAGAEFLQGGQRTDANGLPVPGGYNAQQDAKGQLAGLGYDAMNVDKLGNWSNGGGAGSPSSIPPSAVGATDTGGSATASPFTLGNGGQPVTSGTPGTKTPIQGTSDPYRGGITNTDPNNSLLGKTLLAGPETDRYGIAQDRLKSWDAASEPYFKANLREAGQNAAGRGQLFSGQLRGRLGDITQQHDLERTNAGQGFLQNALEGSIGDAYKNIGIAQDQQKFQQGQQESAFGQQVVQTQVEEALRNGDFQRAMQLLQAGNQGNPSDTALALSGIFGGQAGAANGALGGLINNTTQNNAAKGGQDTIAQIRKLLGLDPTPQETVAQNIPGIRGVKF